MIEFVVPEPDSKLADSLGGKSVLHHVAFAVDDVRNPLPFSQGDLIFDEPAIAPVQRLLVEVVEEMAAELSDLMTSKANDK
jgi:hypothetical protein